MALIALGALVACGDAEPPPGAHQPMRESARVVGGYPIPEIIWPRGQPDHGRYADDPRVMAVREFAVVFALAYNEGKISDNVAMRGLAAPDVLEGLQGTVNAERFRARIDPDWGAMFYYAGPEPFEILEAANTNEGAIVTGCRPSIRGHSTESAVERMRSSAGYPTAWDLEKAEGGRFLVVGIRHLGGSCEISDLHYGLFDPVPTTGSSQAP